METLAVHYGAGLHTVEFLSNPEDARRQINHWIAGQTNEKIEAQLPEGAVDANTRLVLTNAAYFQAPWLHPFDPVATDETEFIALDGTTSTVPMMYQSESFPYAEEDGLQLTSSSA